MLESLAVVGAVLALMGLGAGVVWWGLSKKISGQKRHIDGLNKVIETQEQDNNALEDANHEILRTWEDHARGADLPPVQRIGLLLAVGRARRQAGHVPRASSVGGRQGRLGPPDEEGSPGPEGSGSAPVPGPDQDS